MKYTTSISLGEVEKTWLDSQPRTFNFSEFVCEYIREKIDEEAEE